MSSLLVGSVLQIGMFVAIACRILVSLLMCLADSECQLFTPLNKSSVTAHAAKMSPVANLAGLFF